MGIWHVAPPLILVKPLASHAAATVGRNEQRQNSYFGRRGQALIFFNCTEAIMELSLY
jgi:hypothetical protein